MGVGNKLTRGLALAVGAALCVYGASAKADGFSHSRGRGSCAHLWLNCEDGRTYPFCPIAVTEFGEIVTGRLIVGSGQGVHVRLVPMGVGYRYAGRGIWFDGLRRQAILNFGKYRSVSCLVGIQTQAVAVDGAGVLRVRY